MKRKSISQQGTKKKHKWISLQVGLGNPSAERDNSDEVDGGEDWGDQDGSFNPEEGAAFFYGLEVLDGNVYNSNKECNILNVKDDGITEQEDIPESKGKTSDETDDQQSKSKKKRKKKKKKKKKTQEDGSLKDQAQSTQDEDKGEDHDQPQEEDSNSDPEVEQLQLGWASSAGGVMLHERLCKGLLQQQFYTPTPIQASCLPAAILGRRNIVGAAPTGSGKTLAYLLPILQSIIQQGQEGESKILALILCPTRELALQVSEEMNKLIANIQDQTTRKENKYHWYGTLVGGLSEHKQQRVLKNQKPPILVATPGRLWELMSKGNQDDISHLNDLSQIRFLVIDEADRMIRQGSFPQLKRLLYKVNLANPVPEEKEDDEEQYEDEESDDDKDDNRMKGLQGIPGEAKVVMLDERVLKMIEQQRQEDNGQLPEVKEMDDDEFENQPTVDEQDEIEGDVDITPVVRRQTFVFSATLTLPRTVSVGKGKKTSAVNRVEGAIAEILQEAGARGQTKVVDLSSSLPSFNKKISKDKLKIPKEVVRANETKATRLPPGLKLYQIRCTTMHKDSHLYSFLLTTREGTSGPCLVFCNSIAAVRRVGATLQLLGLPVKMLHAQMAQKARFKSLETLRRKDSRCIVVATDVAARGLDIPSVTTVVHYDVPRATDTFIHRAGRTARGMGENAVGTSTSLIAPSNEKDHKRIRGAVEGADHRFHDIHMDGRLLSTAQQRMNLACKVFECEDAEKKVQKNNQWFKDAAKDAGIDVDPELLDDAGGSRRERQKLEEGRKARAALKKLLAQPMRKVTFSKFLSTAVLAEALQQGKGG